MWCVLVVVVVSGCCLDCCCCCVVVARLDSFVSVSWLGWFLVGF